MAIKHILIVKPSSLGDVINTFPAVSLISNLFPESTIDWLIHPAFTSILEYSPSVKNTIIFPRKKLASPISFFPSFLRLVKNLRKNKYDLIIDFQGLLRSALFAKFAKSREIVGFSHPKEQIATVFYNRKIEVPPEIVHAVDRNLYLAAKAINSDFRKPDFQLPEIKKYSNAVDMLFEKNSIKQDTVCMGIVPGARWQTKRWPPEFFAEVIKTISESSNDITFIIIGDQSEVSCAEQIISLTNQNQNIVSFAGQTGIGELVEIVRHCQLVFTNDSGPMHIAAFLKIPVLALFGPTDPEKTGPYGDRHQIFQPDIDCIKCLKKICNKSGKRCQDTIDPSEVAKKILGTIFKLKNQLQKSE